MNSNRTFLRPIFLHSFIVFAIVSFVPSLFSKEREKTPELQEVIPFAQAESDLKATAPVTSIDPKHKEEAARRVDQRKGTWSFQWGYNRDYYTQSDITFKGPGYNFTLKDIVAKDKPEKFDPSVYLSPSLWEIPQYNFRFTYYFTDKFFIAFGQDHMKYVMSRGQASNIYGYVDPLAIQRAHLGTSSDSAVYLYLFPDAYKRLEGYHNGETINVTPDFLKFEHTDGLNLIFMDVGMVQPIWVSTNGENAFSLVSSVGGGPIICRSDVRLFGEGKNNHFHASGYGVTGYLAGRMDLFKSFFFETGAKAGYIDLPDIFTTGRSKDHASQNFGFLELIVYGGVNF